MQDKPENGQGEPFNAPDKSRAREIVRAILTPAPALEPDDVTEDELTPAERALINEMFAAFGDFQDTPPLILSEAEFEAIPEDLKGQMPMMQDGQRVAVLYVVASCVVATRGTRLRKVFVECDGDEREKRYMRHAVDQALTIVEGFETQRDAAVEFLQKIGASLAPYSYQKTREVGGVVYTDVYSQGYKVATNDPTDSGPQYDPDFWTPQAVGDGFDTLREMGLNVFVVDEKTDFTKPPFMPLPEEQKTMHAFGEDAARQHGHEISWQSLCVARCDYCGDWLRLQYQGETLEAVGPLTQNPCTKAGETQ